MTNTENDEPLETSAWLAPSFKNVQLNYFLYLASYVIGPVAIIALIFAYMNKDKGTEVHDSHYQYQIRTFWIGLLYILISMALTFFVIGILGFIAIAIWWAVRTIKGLMAVSRKEAIANPTTWLW